MAQTAAGELGTQLGQLIFGNPMHTAQVEQQARSAAYLDNQRMQAAAKDRAAAMIGFDQYDSRKKYDPTPLIDPNASLEQRAEAIRLGALANLGSNLSSGLEAYSKGRSEQRLDAADQAFRLGDVARGNQSIAVAAGKPLETTSINNGQVYDKYAAPDQDVALTALGQASVVQKKASAAKDYAGAQSDLAHARLFDKQTSVGGFNPHAGGDGGAPVPAANPLGPHGDMYLQTLDPTQAAQVKALAEGRMAFPTGTALKSPYWQGMLMHVAQYDPGFDAVNYNARAATRKGFTSGKEAQTVNALNTVAEHLGTLSDYTKDLNNTGFQPYNRLKNFIADQTGDPSIARFNTAKKAVADEVAKVWRASGGSQADIEENLHNLNGAQSPEQLNAAIGTLTKLISGKVAALQDQYTSGMGTTQDVRPLVSPEAGAAFEKTLTRAGLDAPVFDHPAPLSAPTPAPAAAAAATPAGTPSYRVGQVITVAGKQYRVTGGDPSDPDLEAL